MACGGLKAYEAQVDVALLGKHHSQRIVEYANDMVNYAKGKKLKDGGPLKLKIGIHTGNVISGVVGEHKPQFSLIGDTVNKTSRVCSKGEDNQIFMSAETKAILKEQSDAYAYDEKTVFMKGLGNIPIYRILKKRFDKKKDGLKKKKQSNTKGGNYGRSTRTDGIQTNRDNFSDSESIINLDQAESPRGDIDADALNLTEEGERKSSDSSSMEKFQENDKGYGKKQMSREELHTRNMLYQLVERPKYLLSFNFLDMEGLFMHQLIEGSKGRTMLFLASYVILEKVFALLHYLIEC